MSQVPDHIGFDALSQRLQTSPHSRAEELEWVRLHGPWSPGLIEYLKRAATGRTTRSCSSRSGIR